MAICSFCNKEMLGKGCSCVPTVIINGKRFNRIKYGDKGDMFPEQADEYNCHDCNCAKGMYHHFTCDSEACPNCGGQLLFCECDVKIDHMSTMCETIN